MSMEQQRLELKNQALLEKISSLVTNYEDQIANLRVDLTIENARAEQAERETADLKQHLEGASEVSEEVPDAKQG